jgi:hypothetical protein
MHTENVRDSTAAPATRPDTLEALIALDEQDCVPPDPALWEHVNEHAYSFSTPGEVTLERTGEHGEYTLRSSAPLLHGLPLASEEDAAGKAVVRSPAQRREDRAARRAGTATGNGRDRSTPLAGLRPTNLPIAYFPRKIVVARAIYGASATGGKVRLSTTVVRTTEGDKHSTVFNGESRDGLRPTHYPYTAVCKVELWTRPGPAGAWANSGSYASGFLVGRRTLLTSGHAFEGLRLSSGMAAIKVIPACWGNQPVFGTGMVTWVRQRRWWHSDSGNDLQLCRLADPVGDQMGFFGAQEYDSDWEDDAVWTMAGFPYDISKYGMSAQHGISVRDDDDGDDIDLDGEVYDTAQIESDADEASGASGSPLFAWFDGDVRAIGVHSGDQDDGTISGSEVWACAAGGEGLVALVRWGRENWDKD